MFVAKSELKNAARLTRARLAHSLTLTSFYISIVFGVICLIALIFYVILLLKETGNSQVVDIKMMDFTFTYMITIVAINTFYNCWYRLVNRNFEVYPQTGVSRFLFTQALFFIWSVSLALLCMVLYLVQYGTIAAIAAFRGNIHLIYKFDMGFVLAGLSVFIIYTSVIFAIAALIAALIRKFRFYAIAVFAIALGLLTANINKSGGSLLKPLAVFLASEQSMLLFIVKGVCLWLVLVTLALIADKHTYYRASSRVLDSLATVITATSVLYLLLSGFMVHVEIAHAQEPIGAGITAIPIPAESSLYIKPIEGKFTTIFTDAYGLPLEEPFNIGQMATPEEIIIDVSALPEEREIIVVFNGSGIDFNKDGVNIIYNAAPLHINRSDSALSLKSKVDYYDYTRKMLLVYSPQSPSNHTGKKLVIQYSPPSHMVDYYDLVPLTNPQFSARLESATLNIDYTFDKNVKAVFLSIWTFMRQFDYYKGKGIVKASVWTMRNESDGVILINR